MGKKEIDSKSTKKWLKRSKVGTKKIIPKEPNSINDTVVLEKTNIKSTDVTSLEPRVSILNREIENLKSESIESKKFRLRAKQFFLTYSQLPDIPDLEEQILRQLEKNFIMGRNAFEYLITIEKHEDGNPHAHVLLCFNSVQMIYSANKLDITLEDKVYHGNYQVVRKKKNITEYVLKHRSNESEPLFTNMNLPFINGQYYSSIEAHLHAVLRNEGLRRALETLYTDYPEEAVRRAYYLSKNLALCSEFFNLDNAAIKEPFIFIKNYSELPPEIEEWVKTKSYKLLIIFGEPGTGKTEIAKALMTERNVDFLYIHHKESLKDFKPYYGGIILDNFDVSLFSLEEWANFADPEGTAIRIRYNMAVIPKNIVKIVTTRGPLKSHLLDEGIQRRAVCVKMSLKDDRTFPDWGITLSEILAEERKIDNNKLSELISNDQKIINDTSLLLDLRTKENEGILQEKISPLHLSDKDITTMRDNIIASEETKKDIDKTTPQRSKKEVKSKRSSPKGKLNRDLKSQLSFPRESQANERKQQPCIEERQADRSRANEEEQQSCIEERQADRSRANEEKQLNDGESSESKLNTKKISKKSKKDKKI